MRNAHIDISKGLDGESVVFVCFDLRADELAAAARAVEAVKTERYRTPRISADDVLELRELTALADELEHGRPATEPADGRAPGEPRGAGPGEPGATGPDDPAPELLGSEPGQAYRKLVFRPARVSVLRDAVAAFVEARDEAEWVRHEDREPLALLRSMLLPLEQLCADAVRAALSPESHVR
jgi:hypothetical protein